MHHAPIGVALSALACMIWMFRVEPAAANDLALQGHTRCGFTDYMWPSSAEDSPTITGFGTIEFDTDSDGKMTAGTMSAHLGDDTRNSGDKVCTYTLEKGERHLTLPGEGDWSMTWKLRPGSDGHCGGYPNLGRTESARDYRLISTSGHFMVSNDGVSK